MPGFTSSYTVGLGLSGGRCLTALRAVAQAHAFRAGRGARINLRRVAVLSP